MVTNGLQAYGKSGGSWSAVGRGVLGGGLGGTTSEWRYGTPGSYVPSASTSGVPSGVSLTTYPSTGGPFGNLVTTAGSTALIVTTPGTVIDSYLFNAVVIIRAANCVVKNCKVLGAAVPTSDLALVDGSNINATNLTVQDCEITATNPDSRWNGVYTWSTTVKRCNIYGTTDGIRIYSTTQTALAAAVQANYIHDLAYDLTDPNQGGGPTHNDCIQIQALASGATTGISVRWNNLQGFLSPTLKDGASRPRDQSNSAIQLTVGTGNSYDALDITNNRGAGGGATFNFAAGTYTNCKATNNAFEPNSYDQSGRESIIVNLTTAGSNGNDFQTGNTWTDGVTPFVLSKGS